MADTRHAHTHTHTPLSTRVGVFFFFFKPRPLNALSVVVVVAATEGGKDTLPPSGQASSCHVQQMQPRLSKENHNSRVRPRQKR